jgi:hypothetical protein
MHGVAEAMNVCEQLPLEPCRFEHSVRAASAHSASASADEKVGCAAAHERVGPRAPLAEVLGAEGGHEVRPDEEHERRRARRRRRPDRCDEPPERGAEEREGGAAARVVEAVGDLRRPLRSAKTAAGSKLSAVILRLAKMAVRNE